MASAVSNLLTNTHAPKFHPSSDIHTETSSAKDERVDATEKLQRRGPMVAAYLLEPSVDKLHAKYRDVTKGRLRKAVIQFDPSDEERQKYEKFFTGVVQVQARVEAGGGDYCDKRGSPAPLLAVFGYVTD